MAYWENLVAEYRERTPTSETLHEETREHIPSGVASTSRQFDPYPFYIDHSDGVYLEDVDGNRYLDYDMNNGAGLCGHTHPKITAALHDQLDEGTLYTMPHGLLAEAATELKKRWSALEKVRFTNSGTEATMHAIRMARAYTGRDKLLKIEGTYHGVHDYVMVSGTPPKGKAGHPNRPMKVADGHGIPDKTVETVEIAPFNDLEATEDIMRDNINEIGAFIVEPVMLNKSVTPPQQDYLEGLKDLCDEYGIVLIFDEVKTGVKVAPGGAAEYYGVQPDMVTMAKSIGGETSVGAFGGSDAIMDQISNDYAWHYGTYNGNPFVLRALVTALRDVLTDDAYQHVNKLGEQMKSGYEDVIEDAGITGQVRNVNSQGMVQFTDANITNYREFMANINDDFHRLFWFGMVNQGIIPHPYGARQQWTISVQHTEEHVDETIEAFKNIAPTLADEQESWH
ncbi:MULTISPECIES: aspartate aminotransferase family protein [Haloferax]|uniref:Glutamate-1-semialdehyde 2,1-aminomutase n=1 Tax=Haloferax marinum TaxID=2666143 RepID=A0A6A8GC45_9EURY|nr:MULTISPECIES: aspartate aminotransferase family protein [Haloferax]KAB1190718.1 aspartate aminotransferase family protein [Haloferax sp. CBA1150]MRW98252.1 aminotransferase class III-fold pyridoxal phosphate-dependent enzyme [Haloferax marinum]